MTGWGNRDPRAGRARGADVEPEPVMNSAPVGKTTRTTWRANVREIAEALGIPLAPDQWVAIESAEDDGDTVFSGWVDIVRWEPHQPSTYQHELAEPPARA